MTEEDRMSMI